MSYQVNFESHQGGHLYLKLKIILVKKFMSLGLFFRTRRCTCVHCLGVQNHANLEKKGCVFCHFHKFGKGRNRKMKKKHHVCKNVIRVYFHTWKIHA